MFSNPIAYLKYIYVNIFNSKVAVNCTASWYIIDLNYIVMLFQSVQSAYWIKKMIAGA